MFNATLYFHRQLDDALIEAMSTDDKVKFAELIQKISYFKLAIFALERLEQDVNK